MVQALHPNWSTVWIVANVHRGHSKKIVAMMIRHTHERRALFAVPLAVDEYELSASRFFMPLAMRVVTQTHVGS
jgi:hypothetical protein